MNKMFDGLRRTMVLQTGIARTLRSLLANVFVLAINIGTGIITARFLGPTGRGEQAVMGLWVQFLAYALTLGIPSALLYNLRRKPDEASQVFSAALLLGTVMGFVTIGVGVVFIPHWLSDRYSPEVVSYARWFMIAAPLVLLNQIFTYVLRAREEFGTYNAIRYLQPLLTLFGLIFLVFAGLLTPLNATLAYVLPVIPIFLYMLVYLWRIYRPTFSGARRAFRALTSYGLRSYGADVTGVLSNELDRALVAAFLGPAAVGLYVVAMSLSRMLDVFQAAVVSVIFPKAVGQSQDEVVVLIERGARVCGTVTLLAAAGLGLLGPWALSFVYGSQFLGAVPVLRLLLLAVALNGITLILCQAFMALDRPGFVTVVQISGLGLIVVLLPMLVPHYGLEGAGIALVVSAVIRLAFALASFPLVLKVRVPSLLLKRSDITQIVALLPLNRTDKGA